MMKDGLVIRRSVLVGWGATAGLSSSGEGTVGQANRGARPFNGVRRLAIRRGICFGVVLLCCSGVSAADKDAEQSAAQLITPAAERAIELGLKWLGQQQHDDGGFGAGPFRGNVAVSALAGMAMMSGGSTPGRGPYGGQLSRCVDYLLGSTQPSGFIAGPDASRGPMYGHGFATHVPGRMLRHVAPARAARKTDQGREDHRQLPE